MGAPRGHRGHGARRLLWGAAAVVVVLPLAAMGRSSVRSSMAADRAETEIAFACGETALSVFVVGSVTPPSTAPGGRVGLTVDLRIPATASIPPEAQVAVTWLLPAAIPTVRHLAVTARDGVSATSSSTAPGAFTVVLTAAEAETPGELGATVTARLVTSAIAAAGLVSVPGPSGFTLLSAAGSTIGPTVCVAVSPPAPLAGFTGTLPDEPDEPEEPEEPVPPEVAARRQRPVQAANALRQVLAAARFRAPAQAPQRPVLVLTSRGDRLVHTSCSEALARAWGSPLARHPGAGHDLPLDDPDWVVAQVRQWVERLQPG